MDIDPVPAMRVMNALIKVNRKFAPTVLPRQGYTTGGRLLSPVKLARSQEKGVQPS
jgi:hypothetical protein